MKHLENDVSLSIDCKQCQYLIAIIFPDISKKIFWSEINWERGAEFEPHLTSSKFQSENIECTLVRCR